MIYALILTVFVNGSYEEYALDTHLSGEDCIERMEDFPMEGMSGKLHCEFDGGKE